MIDSSGIAIVSLQAPDKPRRFIGERIDVFEAGDEISQFRGINGEFHFRDIELG